MQPGAFFGSYCGNHVAMTCPCFIGPVLTGDRWPLLCLRMLFAGRWCNGPERAGPQHRRVADTFFGLRHELGPASNSRGSNAAAPGLSASVTLQRRCWLGFATGSIRSSVLVAELADETLRRTILPGLARIDQCRLGTLIDDPLQGRETDSGPLSDEDRAVCCAH